MADRDTGYSIVLTGLFVFRFTSGDPMSPSSQKLLGVFSHLSVCFCFEIIKYLSVLVLDSGGVSS